MTNDLWFNRPVSKLHTENMATDLGNMTLTIQPDTSLYVYGEMLVTVHRINYSVHVYADLNLRTEEWHTRMTMTRRPDNSKGFTQKAYRKVRDTIIPTLEKWLDENAMNLFLGHKRAILSQLDRANHKLDSITEQVNIRRNDLKRIHEIVLSGGTPAERDIEMLMDLYSHHWRF